MGDRKIAFSGRNLDLPDIAAHHRHLEQALRLYLSESSPLLDSEFPGYLRDELTTELDARLAELDMTSTLSVLASVEAAFESTISSDATGRREIPYRSSFESFLRRKATALRLKTRSLTFGGVGPPDRPC